MEVKFCENNFSYGTEKVAKALEENHKDVVVTVEGCLGYCGDCAAGPYALVDDEMIEAETADELLKKIENMI
jgi:uncharacterized protein YuzB (UPF0349 family)